MSNFNQEVSKNVNFENKVELMRKELRNIRAQMRGLKELHKKEVLQLKKAIQESKQCKCTQPNLNEYCNETGNLPSSESKSYIKTHTELTTFVASKTKSAITLQPIGRMQESWFTTKNGTPRQPTICRNSKGTIDIEEMSTNFPNCSNPQYAIENLSEFSHIWILFYFDQSVHNRDDSTPATEYNQTFAKTKVAPPRLGGQRVGLFSTRSPHRPNLIGLTLAKLEAVNGSKLHVSGIDLLQGTPILDIKPYIPHYDMPPKFLAVISSEPDLYHSNKNEPLSDIGNPSATSTNNEQFNLTLSQNSDTYAVKTPSWVQNKSLKVLFTQRSLNNIDSILQSGSVESKDELLASITSILQADPRSCYRKDKCSDRLYYFSLNKNIHITAWFDQQEVKNKLDSVNGDQEIVAEVLKVILLPSDIDKSGTDY